MIRSFRCPDTARLFADESVRRFQSIERAARRKLLFLHGARRLEDLMVPPGNRLDCFLRVLRVLRASVVNSRRVCFAWRSGDAFEVEIVDYH